MTLALSCLGGAALGLLIAWASISIPEYIRSERCKRAAYAEMDARFGKESR